MLKCALLALALACGSANAAPFEIYADNTGHRVSGRIILREPVTDRVLGTYAFVTGGFGRGSAPFGKYEVGQFQGLDFDPLHIGERWLIHHVGMDDGEAWDVRVNDTRTELELHAMHGRWNGTLGCIGISGGPKVYADFQKNLRFLIAWLGTVSFEFNPPDPWFAVARKQP